MSDFEEKLNSVLSNPDAMSQIMNLAQSLNLGGGGGESPQGGQGGGSEPPSPSPPAGGGDGFPMDCSSFFPMWISRAVLAARSTLSCRSGFRKGRRL